MVNDTLEETATSNNLIAVGKVIWAMTLFCYLSFYYYITHAGH